MVVVPIAIYNLLRESITKENDGKYAFARNIVFVAIVDGLINPLICIIDFKYIVKLL